MTGGPARRPTPRHVPRHIPRHAQRDDAPTRRQVLALPGFRPFFGAQSVSAVGDRVSEVAIPLIGVVVLHASAAQVSLLTALVWLPQLASPFVGAWMDRQRAKVPWMVAADLIRLVVLVTVPVAAALDALTLSQMYVVATLTGAGTVLFNGAFPAFFVRIVRRDQYLAANSLVGGSRSFSYVAGPALGGGLAQLLTAPLALLADAASYLASAVLLMRVRRHDVPRDQETAAEEAPTEQERRSLVREASEGLVFILRDPVLRAALGCATTANFFSLVFVALVVLFASRELGLDAGLIGLALGGGAVGGVVGAVVMPGISRRLGVGRSVVLGGLVFPAAIGITASADGPPATCAGLLALSEFVGGLGSMAFDINLGAIYSSVIPDHLRSRVGGAFAAVNFGSRPLGALLGGALATVVGVRATLWVAALGGMVCVLWLLPSPIPRLRTLGDLPDPREAQSSSGRSSSA